MRRLFLVVAALALMLVPASSASAELTGPWAKYKGCPLTVTTLEVCVYAESSSGNFTVGNKSVPLVNPVVLRGGLDSLSGEIFGPTVFYAPTDGPALSKTPQPVPGGLLGITAPTWWPSILRDLFNETINNGFTGVTATVELAGPASAIELSPGNTLTREGVALGMPVKVKLSNPFLGSNCYIGSNSNPIKLKLITGTTSPPPPNTPISGSPGEIDFEEEFQIIKLKNNKLVDNSFSAPGANGCGGILFSWAVDPFVDSILGTPSAAGKNTAILQGTTYLGAIESVRAHQ